ncbi:MAG: aminotransferase class V-fold PLP-dependent enzyme [Methanobacterium sp.]
MENSKINIRADIPLLEEIIYLDAASTTPTPEPVIRAICDYYHHFNANIGRGAYKIAVKATNEFENARKNIAEFVNAAKNEVIFTKNTTEAINLVANGLKFKKGDSIIVPNIEHHSNFLPWLNLKEKGINIKIIKTDKYGIINALDVEKAVDNTTKLITTTHISNSIGSCQPIYEIGKIAEENEILYLIDAAQSAGHIKLNVKETKADFVTFPGHKGLLGPVGTGFLYCKSEVAGELKPMNLGGGTVSKVSEEKFVLEPHPAKFEGGTQNIAGIIGLGAAVKYIDKIGIGEIEKHSKKLTKYMFDEINAISRTICYGDPENIHGIVGFNVENMNSHDVAKILDEIKNICVRSGYHCAIPAIKHIGADSLGGTVRASVHYYNTKEEVQILVETVEKISKFAGGS